MVWECGTMCVFSLMEQIFLFLNKGDPNHAALIAVITNVANIPQEQFLWNLKAHNTILEKPIWATSLPIIWTWTT